jgi:aspartate-semialdehyde dehydrogenase
VNPDRLRKAPNIAIVGSSSPVGKELKEMVEASDLPIGKLSLFETEEYAGLLQEFAGEIQITQIISPLAFQNVDIAFFACSPEIMEAYAASGAPFPDLTIDLTQTRRSGVLFLSGVSDASVLKNQGYIINPHPATIVLVRVLSKLQQRFGVQNASVTILQPASERGSAGVDELQEQTVELLNFQQVQNRVFSGQLAFNILPEQENAARTEEQIRDQISTLLSGAAPVPVIMALQTPVFHSHGFSMFVSLQGSPSVDAVRDCLKEDGAALAGSESQEAFSPVAAVGTDKIHVARISSDPNRPGVFALWLVADNLRIAAANALQTVESLMFAPAQM